MTTIRNLCCNDLLDITHMLIDIPESMSPLSHYMVNMAEFSNNCLVAVAPGNQIKGYITALNEGKGKEKRCEISEMNYCYPTEDIGHTAEILVKTLDEAADKILDMLAIRNILMSLMESYKYDITQEKLVRRRLASLSRSCSNLAASKTGLSIGAFFY